MRRLRNCLVALCIGCCAPALIWVGAGAALVQSRRAKRAMTCSVDTDCPPGYVCMGGRCMPVES